MSQAFSRSLRSMDEESVGAARILRCLLLVLASAWCGWFFWIPVQVALPADNARIEASAVSHRVQAPATGSVVHGALELGAMVEAGDVLLELDTTAETNELLKWSAQARTLDLERAALDEQIRAEERALESDRIASQVHLEEALVLEEEARALAALGAEAQERKDLLGREGALSQLDVLQGRTDTEEREQRLLALEAATRRVRADRNVNEAERLGLLAGLRRERSELESKRQAAVAASEVLSREMERRRIRAPVSGQLGDVRPLTVGSLLQAGESITSIVPKGSLRIVAEFPPAAALGRLRPGQAAQMQLDAYPWTTFGQVQAEVRHVAREVHEGKLRVELAIVGEASSLLPLEHGLTGRVRVEVDRLTPAALLFRIAGRAFASRQAEP
jgi:multidrug resistance efflux pump